MKDQKITFLGCGNMGTSLISGLIANGYPAPSLSGIDPDENQRRKLAGRHDVRITATIAEGVPGADVIVLAVKPQTVPAALAEVKQSIKPNVPWSCPSPPAFALQPSEGRSVVAAPSFAPCPIRLPC